MRIGVVAPPWTPVPPPLYGGTELIVDLLCRGFQDAGHQGLLFTTGDSTCPVPRPWVLEQADGVRMGVAASHARHPLARHAAIPPAQAHIRPDHTILDPV